MGWKADLEYGGVTAVADVAPVGEICGRNQEDVASVCGSGLECDGKFGNILECRLKSWKYLVSENGLESGNNLECCVESGNDLEYDVVSENSLE